MAYKGIPSELLRKLLGLNKPKLKKKPKKIIFGIGGYYIKI